MNETFSKGEALKFGWQALKANLVFLVGLMALILMLNLLPEVGRWQTEEQAPPLALFWVVAGYLIQVATQMGLIRISLKLVDGKPPRYSELFGDLETFGRYLAANLLFLLIVAVGLLLLVVPGLVWSVKYQFAPFLIVDRQRGIKEVFRKSGEITAGVKGEVFLFFLLVMAINLAGLLAFGLGIFTTLPATMIAYAFLYRKLLERKKMVAVETKTEVPAPVS